MVQENLALCLVGKEAGFGHVPAESSEDHRAGVILVLDDAVIDDEILQRDVLRQAAVVPEVMGAIVGTDNEIEFLERLLDRSKAAVTDDDISLPGAPVITPESNQAGRTDLAVIHQDRAETDHLDAHITKSAIGQGHILDTHMGVEPGERAVIHREILAEIGTEQAPVPVVVDVRRLTTVLPADIDGPVGGQVV